MQHGIVDVKGHDPRIDLEALPVEILIERCSKFIRRHEISDEVEERLATTPARTE